MALLDSVPTVKPRAIGLALPVIFTLTIFLSASLLFFVQPLFAALVLPHIGGAPAVWTTAMLFFQVVLLFGYVYAHLLSKYVPLGWQLGVHAAFWVLALAFLPLSISDGWRYDPQASTTWQTLSLFAVGVGIPFAMLSANAPLLQSWYSKTTGPSAQDPYFLYGSSNLGSLIALLAFPLLAAPYLGATVTAWGWTAIFVLFGGFLLASGGLALHFKKPTDQSLPNDERVDTVSLITGLKWVFIAFVPSSLMLAITTKVSTDMGAMPLIWVVPLAIYIFSFVVTFTNRPLIPDQALSKFYLACCAIMAFLMSGYSQGFPTWASALLFAPALMVVAAYAHRQLYLLRPASSHLTVFYICMSVGGALGGLFNSIIAPTVFDKLHEGWISVACAACIGAIAMGRPSVRNIAIGIALAIVAQEAFDTLRNMTGGPAIQVEYQLIAIAVFASAVVAFWRSLVAMALAISVFLLLDAGSRTTSHHLFQDRSFFGTHSIYDQDNVRIYGNGTTIHGYQFIDELEPGVRPTPLSYYHPESPMAQVLTTSEGLDTANVAVVGLGVGSLACYAKPGQTWEFYEIDHMVDQAARTPSLFTFMSECAPGSSTHLGDARIVLAQHDVSFDIMVLDAYSSDSIPVHLVTIEAVEMYLDRLAKDGQLVFHISNRYYDLSQPLARIARDLGLNAIIRDDRDERITAKGTQPSVVMVLSADTSRTDKLLQDPRWQIVRPDHKPAWTDDRSNILSALK